MEHPREVVFDGVFAQANLASDPPVRQSGHDSDENFELSGRQSGPLSTTATADRLGQESVEHFGQIRDDIAPHPPLARHDSAQALGDVLQEGVLPENSAYAQLKRADDIELLAG